MLELANSERCKSRIDEIKNKEYKADAAMKEILQVWSAHDVSLQFEVGICAVQ